MSAAVNPTIVGAGLAGLIAAHAWPKASIVEASPQPNAAHRALLRFRTEAVATLTGIEFRRVTVRKGLWADGEFCATNIRWANAYARKVIGAMVGDRSIWSLDTVERFIAPDTFYEQLIESVGHRVQWSTPADFAGATPLAPIISTAPLPVVLAAVGKDPGVDFPRAPIQVQRWIVPNADVFQTVYFPEEHLALYRASITGHTLIAESVATRGDDPHESEHALERAFGLSLSDCQPLGTTTQRYGKIAPIHDPLRKHLLFQLTHEHNIFSLGRFATWRNILLDDVVADIGVVKRLLRAGGAAFDLRLGVAQ